MDKHMRCENCGAILDDGLMFCTKCGAMITVDKQSEPAFTVAQTPNFEQQSFSSFETNGADGIKMENFTSKEQVTPRSKSKLPYIIIGSCVIVLLLLLGFTNFAALENTVRKITATPEKYYQWVEEKQLKEAAQTVTALYKNYFIEAVQSYDEQTELQVSFDLGEGAEDWLEILEDAGADLTWLDSGKAVWSHSLKEGIAEEKVGLSLSDVELMEIRTITDFNEENMYIGIPTLSPNYLSGDLEDIMGENVLTDSDTTMALLELMKNLDKALPTVTKLNKLINKYTEMALSYVDDVEMANGKTIRAAGISGEYTRLEVTIDAEMVSEMMENVFAALGEDEEVKEIIFTLWEAVEETKDLDLDLDLDADDIYEAFTDVCSEFEDLAEEIDGDGEIVMLVYVNGKGDVVGREFEVDGGSISMLCPEDGKKVGYKYSVESGYTNVTVEGVGKKSGNKVTGDFVFECNGNEIVEFSLDKLDEDALKEGFVNGTIEVKLASGLGDLYEAIYGYYDSSYVSDMLETLEDISLVLNSKMNENKKELTLAANEKDEMLVTLGIAYSTESGKVASIPTEKLLYDVTDEDDIVKWWENLDWSTMLKNLDKASLPSEVIDLIEELSEIDGDGDEFDDVIDEFEDVIGGVGYSSEAASFDSATEAKTETATDAILSY